MNKFLRILKPEQRPGTLQDLMQQQLLWMLLLRIVLYTLLLAINLVLLDDRFEIITMPPTLLVLFILGVYLVTIGSAFYLINNKEKHRTFGFIQTLLDAGLASLLVYLTGASQSIFTSVYFFPIIAGGLLIPIKGGLIGAASSTLLYAAILAAEYFGRLPDFLYYFNILETHNLYNSINHFATKGLTFFLAAVISALFGARLRSTAQALSSTKYDFDRLSLLYKQIFDNINTGIITVDGNGTITSTNNATTGIIGLPASEMTGKSLYSLLPGIDLQNVSPRNACDFERSDGQKIRVGYAHTSLHKPGSREDSDEGPSKEDITIITLKDISEIERLEAQMRQAEKLAAIGMMSAGIAHDFRNPLAAISGSAQILAQEFSDKQNEQHHNYELTKIIVRESDRLAKTITDFLKFARPDTVDREHFLLQPCIEDLLQGAKADPKWPSSCSVELNIPHRYSIWADEKQLFTVISHLVYNALAHCPKGKECIRITAENTLGPNKKEMSAVTISDNGKGVIATDMKKIFEPFYTTRSDGTGLGLAIVKQTIEAHNGFIVVGSSDDGGAAFTLFLPFSAQNNYMEN